MGGLSHALATCSDELWQLDFTTLTWSLAGSLLAAGMQLHALWFGVCMVARIMTDSRSQRGACTHMRHAHTIIWGRSRARARCTCRGTWLLAVALPCRHCAGGHARHGRDAHLFHRVTRMLGVWVLGGSGRRVSMCSTWGTASSNHTHGAIQSPLICNHDLCFVVQGGPGGCGPPLWPHRSFSLVLGECFFELIWSGMPVTL